MAKYTYTSGPKVVLERDFTTQDVAALCDDLSRTFGPGHVFGPERITEGGIEMLDWPGKKPGQYKTFRFNGSNLGFGYWPWIVEGTLEQWRHALPVTIFSRNAPRSIDLFLKAFHGAPCWTEEELRLVRDCFERLGFLTRNRPKGTLVLRGELGEPRS